jgi:hypothetical protein
MRQPRIELGAQQWECWILPLNHWRVMPIYKYLLQHSHMFYLYSSLYLDPSGWIHVLCVGVCDIKLARTLPPGGTSIQDSLVQRRGEGEPGGKWREQIS